MKMSRKEYLERKQRIEDGEGSDDDRRLVDLHASHFESDGDNGLEQIDVHTSKQQTEDDTQPVGITGSADAEVVPGPARKAAAKKATQGQRQNGTR